MISKLYEKGKYVADAASMHKPLRALGHFSSPLNLHIVCYL